MALQGVPSKIDNKNKKQIAWLSYRTSLQHKEPGDRRGSPLHETSTSVPARPEHTRPTGRGWTPCRPVLQIPNLKEQGGQCLQFVTQGTGRPQRVILRMQAAPTQGLLVGAGLCAGPSRTPKLDE